MSKPPRPGSYGQPTIKDASGFNAEADAKVLRNAMKGFGTNESEITKILSNRSSNQRQAVKSSYQSLFGRELIEDLKSELGGTYEKAILALMEEPIAYYAETVRKAVSGSGTDEDDLIEVLFCLSNDEIIKLKEIYNRKYKCEMIDDIKGDVAGTFQKILLSILSGKRTELTMEQHQLLTQKGPQAVVDAVLANKEAREMWESGEKNVGTDEGVFVRILCTRHQYQLQATFDEYKKLTGKELTDSIRSEFGAVDENALISLVQINKNRPAFFAKRLNRAIAGQGTDEEALLRIIITRSEIDLNDVKREYQTIFATSLEQAVQSEVSGDFNQLLMDILNGN